jgi:pyruvate/2-oxoglutarate dehydrogenase complex dihydrolipoamide dehydrogenase (E3) component
MTVQEHDLIAVGGGTAGLVSAAESAYLGANPALVERAALGGDCLWTGCVPSKALLASSRRGRLHGRDPCVRSIPLVFHVSTGLRNR